MVAQLRFGAGIKGKVLDSFAAGLPFVMSPIAAEGLPLPVTLQSLVGTNAAALADLIVRFNADEAANEAAGDAAKSLVSSGFSSARVTAALRKAIGGPPCALAPGSEGFETRRCR